MKHPYSEVLIAIAEGKEIQELSANGVWTESSAAAALACIHKALWPPERFRVKPATILINGVEVEAPGVGDLENWVRIHNPDKARVIRFATLEARDAAYAALVKPFGEVV